MHEQGWNREISTRPFFGMGVFYFYHGKYEEWSDNSG